jgi:NodT family efflux transporter outer membrane factor (OMF) lipoprotein
MVQIRFGASFMQRIERTLKSKGGICSRHSSRGAILAALVALSFAGGCTVGPKYVKPSAEVPAEYKETGDWKPAQPSDSASKGNWWEVYQDPQLDSLQNQIAISNQTLKAAEAQFAAARAALKVTRSNFFPTVSTNPSATHTSGSENRPLKLSTPQYQDYVVPVDVSYEPDLWGSVRRSVESSRSEAEASAADLANVELSVRAELAVDYFELRGLDAQKDLLDRTVVSYEKALELTESRYKGGLASAVEVAQAETQLQTTRAQSQEVEIQRSSFEHAIAALIGKPASSFELPHMPLTTPPLPIPAGLPSDLLERRPDISAAERRVEEANAQIGVAKAAYYPLVSLTGTGGFESGVITTLFQGPSAFWFLGGAAAETLFDAGRRRGVTQQAIAQHDVSVANYRQAVLTAFQEVEDNLATLRILDRETKTQAAAVDAAQRSLALSINRYRGGVTSYLEVTTAQSAALSDEVTAVNLLTRQMTASVLLVKALGGGWDVSQIPHV